MTAQVLDSMDIERERGITIKAQTVRLAYTARDGVTYEFNLVDTPGHVDFSYEVSRSLRACEGSLLLVDATQGVEAQTLANAYQAIDADHEIIPVLNKIDLPAAEPDRIKQQIEDIVGLDADDALPISAKTGAGIDEVLEAIVTRLPPPVGEADAPLKALLVDSWYDAYLGVVTLVRVKDGTLVKGQKIRMMGTGAVHLVDQVGAFTPKRVVLDRLGPGEIGFITASIKDLADARVGDTITDDRRPATEPLPGFRPSQPVVFCGMFPVDAADYEDLRDSLGKLRLNDASFEYEPEHSAALGFGLPLRLFGPAPSRDHPRAADARVRSRPGDHRTLRRLPRASHQGRGAGAAQPGRHARSDRDQDDRGALDQGHHPGPGRVSGLGAVALHREARRAGGAHLCRHARAAGLSPAAERGGLRLLRPPEVAIRAAMPASTTSSTAMSRATWSSSAILINGDPVDSPP